MSSQNWRFLTPPGTYFGEVILYFDALKSEGKYLAVKKKWPFMNHQNATHYVKSHQIKHQNVAEKYIKVCRKNAITVL